MSSLVNRLFHLRRNIDLNNQETIKENIKYDTNFLINSLQQVVFQIDTTGKWEYLNSTWERLTGHSIDNTLGTYLIEYVHPKDKIKVEEYLQNLCSIKNQADHSVNIRILSNNNKPKWVVLRATAAYKNNSFVIDSISGTFTDISEKHYQQEQLQAKYRSLNNLLNHYPGMAYRCRNDQYFTIEYVSSACYELIGYRYEQLLHNVDLTYKNIIHPDDRKRVIDAIQNNLKDEDYYELTHRIITADGSTQWVLNKGRGNFSSSGELLSFEGVLIDFEKQREEQRRLLKKSLYDPDTKILNKDLFINRLEHAIQKTKSRDDYVFSLLIICIDQYSQLIENLGLESYEITFTEIVRRIIDSLEPSISLCRVQDDQLGILLDSSEYSIKNITAILSQIQAQVQAPLSIEDNEIYITASIGVVIGNSNYQDKEKVFADALDAVNRAKSLGGARYELSDLVTHGKAALQTHIETELEQALKQNKFLVYWQPLVNLLDGNLAGLEARLVWPHPIRGLLYAEQFVPIAEETQLITPLWEWMLNDASRQIEKWNSTIKNIEHLTLSIIVTGATLLDADSILRLREKLLSVKPNLCSLIVGVSEEVLLHAPKTTETMLKPVKGKDIQLLLDRYGSRQTSLELLRDMPIDLIRLDQELIRNCVKDRGRFIKAICSLAHELDISVIAYNVTKEEELKTLQNAKVDFAQGPCVSNPIDENSAIQTLKEIVIKQN